MQKRIGIDCRMWGETGIGRYLRGIITELAKLDRENEYVLFVLRKDFPKIEVPDNFIKVVSDVRWYTLKEQIVFLRDLYRHKLNLLFVPHFNLPLLYFKKSVVTVHDLTPLKVSGSAVTTLPYSIYLLKRFFMLLTVYLSMKKASAIFTVSNFVKDEIMFEYGIRESKIVVTSNATSENFKPISEDKIDGVLKKYRIEKPYLFYIGTAYPHKNIMTLIEAFGHVLEKNPDYHLVLAGKKSFFYDQIESKTDGLGYKHRINFTGYIDDKDLPSLYSGATACVQPSLYEGFGLQILEAFSCGTKVVCSNTTSLPEVGGNIAYYFNPKDPKGMSKAINSCLSDNDDKRVQLAYEHVNKFSWQTTTKQVLKTFRKNI